jgi:hypothetical protein
MPALTRAQKIAFAKMRFTGMRGVLPSDRPTLRGDVFSGLAMPSAPSPGRGRRASHRAMPMPLAFRLRGAAR